MTNEQNNKRQRSRDNEARVAELTFQHRMLIGLGMVVAVVLLVLFLWQAVYVLLLAFGGVLLAIFLRALSGWISAWARLPQGLSLMIVVLGLLGIATALGVVLVPRITEQVYQLQEEVPRALGQVTQRMEQHRLGQLVLAELREMTGDQAVGPEVAQRAASALTSTLTAIGGLLLVFFVGVYLAATPQMYVNGALYLLPKARRARGEEVLHSIGYALKWWLMGRLFAMAFVGVATIIGLWIFGVPLSLTLGIVAAILDFIPNIGPIIAAVPAVLLAFVISPAVALYVIIWYTVVQQIESYVVTPLVQHRVVKLPPAVTIVAQVLFFLLLGWIGLILATPLTVAAIEFIKGVYVHDVLGDDEVEMLAVEKGEVEPAANEHVQSDDRGIGAERPRTRA